MAPLALIEIVVTSIIALLPTSTGGAPWYKGFAWKYVNYTILVVPGALDPAVDLLARVGEELVHRAEDDRQPAGRDVVGRRDRE